VLGLILLIVGLASSGRVWAGDLFTGYQNDHKGQYFSYLGIRTSLLNEQNGIQPFVQVFGAGLGYAFKDQGQELDAKHQFVTPAFGLKYAMGSWTWLAMVGPQIRWQQEETRTGRTVHENPIGAFVQIEGFYWQEEGIFHAVGSYADIDRFFYGRLRKTHLVHKSSQGCCSTFVGWEVAGMGNTEFYAVQTGPLIQVPIERVTVTVKGGYQYTRVFESGGYGGVEFYYPF
jgi:hypothetical protein